MINSTYGMTAYMSPVEALSSPNVCSHPAPGAIMTVENLHL